uniref:Secreted protein n=1 Tax=Romanomermis culicivorax TaxID=13658 RepID=A0A915I824_ROMCU
MIRFFSTSLSFLSTGRWASVKSYMMSSSASTSIGVEFWWMGALTVACWTIVSQLYPQRCWLVYCIVPLE